MHKILSNTAVLKLEESLIILERCLQSDDSSSATSLYIKRLKQIYSPILDFKHSRAGACFYAALRCICICYFEQKATYHLPLSRDFKRSLQCLLSISMPGIDYRKTNSCRIEKLILLGEIYNLQSTTNMRSRILLTLANMSSTLLVACET